MATATILAYSAKYIILNCISLIVSTKFFFISDGNNEIITM